MKFLVDANLPPRLCGWLQSRRHEAEHLFDLDLLDATDTAIWRRAEVQNLIIVSKDVDFYDRALVLGPSPQVVHVSVGNCSIGCDVLEITGQGGIATQMFTSHQQGDSTRSP